MIYGFFRNLANFSHSFLIFFIILLIISYVEAKGVRYVLHIRNPGFDIKIYLNGKEVFKCTGGEVAYEVTEDVKKGENKLRVVIGNLEKPPVPLAPGNIRCGLKKDVSPYCDIPFDIGKEDTLLVDIRVNKGKIPKDDIWTEVVKFKI